MDLADQTCRPCRGDEPPLNAQQLAALAAQVPAWRVVDQHHLTRELTCSDFRAALALVLIIGDEADTQGHHPEIQLSWGRVGLTLFTHTIDGLSEADFVLAARIDRLVARARLDSGSDRVAEPGMPGATRSDHGPKHTPSAGPHEAAAGPSE